MTAESSRASAEEQRKIDHENRSVELDGKANKTQEDWSPITLLNNWTGNAYYMQDEFGTNHIKAELSLGSNAVHTPIMYLPVDIAPFDDTLIISGFRSNNNYSKFYFYSNRGRLELRVGNSVTDSRYSFHYSWRM